MVVIELLGSISFDKYKIQPKVRLSFLEMLGCYKDVMRMFFLVVGPLQLVSYPSIKVIFLLGSASSFFFFSVNFLVNHMRLSG